MQPHATTRSQMQPPAATRSRMQPHAATRSHTQQGAWGWPGASRGLLCVGGLGFVALGVVRRAGRGCAGPCHAWLSLVGSLVWTHDLVRRLTWPHLAPYPVVSSISFSSSTRFPDLGRGRDGISTGRGFTVARRRSVLYRDLVEHPFGKERRASDTRASDWVPPDFPPFNVTGQPWCVRAAFAAGEDAVNASDRRRALFLF